jgi:hypothetical protein
MIYIYLPQMGFRPVAGVGKLVQKQYRDSNLQKEEQYTKQYIYSRIHKIENERTKQDDKQFVNTCAFVAAVY